MIRNLYNLSLLTLLFLITACSEKQVNIELIDTHTNGFHHPTQILISGDDFIIAEMKKPFLYKVKNLNDVTSQSKKMVGLDTDSALNSPHFMTVSDNSVYVTEGRGNNVAYYSLSEEAQQKKLFDQEILNRPHGICEDNQGWIYITDSVNSRLVRIQRESKQFQVFADKQKRIAYGRQLLCRKDGLWLSNSYEKAFKLNSGTGSNILKITDFESGDSEIMVEYKDTNTTGLAVLDNRYLVVGRWSGKYDVVVYDLKLKTEIKKIYTFDKALDAPYGITVDEKSRKFYIAFLGLARGRAKNENGGIKVFSY